jgi:hypothetical protein
MASRGEIVRAVLVVGAVVAGVLRGGWFGRCRVGEISTDVLMTGI